MIKMNHHPLSGIYAASITPLNEDFSPDLDAIPKYLRFLANNGCHGALILGTTGEGPSFDDAERLAILKAALEIRSDYPNFSLLVGTGTPSLTETISLTKTAFDLGVNGVVTLPPYYYHQATSEGLFAWFRELIHHAVPNDGYLLGYHIPTQSRVPLNIDLLSKLKDTYPIQFAGIKDSSGDPEHSKTLSEYFGDDLLVLIGSDALLLHSLDHHGSGCITALANLYSSDLRKVWDAYQKGDKATEVQKRMTALRTILMNYTPYPPTLKALLHQNYNLPLWSVRPPLLSISRHQTQKVIHELATLEKELE
jgi:4-hydroxy-tetrahydrodipicolinate synthase